MTLSELHKRYWRRGFSELLVEFSSRADERFPQKLARHAASMWGFCCGFQAGLGSAVASALHRATEHHADAQTCLASVEQTLQSEAVAAQSDGPRCPICGGQRDA